ncbi:unnamed protein product [Lampetra fluviatilis]
MPAPLRGGRRGHRTDDDSRHGDACDASCSVSRQEAPLLRRRGLGGGPQRAELVGGGGRKISCSQSQAGVPLAWQSHLGPDVAETREEWEEAVVTACSVRPGYSNCSIAHASGRYATRGLALEPPGVSRWNHRGSRAGTTGGRRLGTGCTPARSSG